MVFLLSGINSLSIPESLQISLLGMAIVFVVLISLFALIRLLRNIMDFLEKRKPSADAPPKAVEVNKAADPISAGDVKLNSLDDKTAAMLLAIAAEETGIPLNELRVKSMREVNPASGKKAGTIEMNKKYVFKIGRESTDIMKYNITLNGKVYEVEVERGEAAITNAAAAFAPAPAAAAVHAAPIAPSAPIPGGKTVTSPLPGTVLNIPVKPGDTVKAGQTLIVIEAMKMENEIPAPSDGRVAQILVLHGASVNTGTALITLE